MRVFTYSVFSFVLFTIFRVDFWLFLVTSFNYFFGLFIGRCGG